MLLTKLELKGFKSFGDKVTINFDEGITGIVGPNGCGKSNIVDAIRWVLGEQKTRTLRSEKMENVIFNGTKTRKATQMAEVSLSFNNTKNLLPTEYSEVTIARRYFRSGESEYLLNGVSCRLKDITNLFLDTGITSNSYAIIELKMVDDILNDKDNSRRSLFEEASGISKFKKRKKETLRKLEDTDGDLERVEDLLYEIEKNMKSLEKQARQTEKYYKLKEDYKALSIKLAWILIKNFNVSLEKTQKQIQQQQDEKSAVVTTSQEKEAAIQKKKSELIKTEKELAEKQKALNDHVAKIRQYENEKKVKNERLRFLNDKSESLKEQIEQDKQVNVRTAFSIKSLTQEKINATNRLKEIEGKRDELKEEYESQKKRCDDIREEVEALRKVYQNSQNQVFQLSKSLEIKEIQIESFRQELEKNTTDTSERSETIAEFETRLKELEKQIKLKNSQLEKVKHEENNIQKRIEDTEKTIEVVRQEQTQINRKIDAKQNEYNLTKSLVENLEGFPEAIKFLKKHTNWKKNAPLLSDIITCDEEYRITIENYLEPYLNYYIVESEEDAYKAINILSDASKGKAHFFILDKIKNYKPQDTVLYDNAFPATQIIEYDNKYRKLMSYILDNVYIVDGSDSAAIPDHVDSVFISKSGKYTKRRFSLSGGSVGLFEGKKIGRVKNLDKLAKEIKKLQKQSGEVDQSLADSQDELANLKKNSKKSEIEEIQSDLNKTNEQYVSIKTKHEQFRELVGKSDLKKEDLSDNISRLEKEIKKAVPELEKERKDLSATENKLNEKRSDLETQENLLAQKSTAFNEQNILYHQQENQVNKIEQELTYKTESNNSSSERIEKNQKALEENSKEINLILEKTETNDQEIISMYKEKEVLEKSVNEVEKNYYTHRGDIDGLDNELKEIQRKKETVDELILELKNAQNDLKLELNSVKERISVEFNIDTADIVPTDEFESLKEQDLRDKIDKIKNRLESMGQINPMAMEAYNEIKERNDFITTQRDDLISARDSLMNTIDEIDTVAKETFLDAFKKIEDNFIKVFRSLFTQEDDCDLLLSNPDDPLNSSIEIIAKPKGKKPLSINQLSGGEKTLTATSLLFAIYLLKPAPFCIFDEVDAPLDDANIDKFNNIIRAFSKDSQFIIVTHNKRTMTQTDIIYGITMIEQGISRVVPVDLRELD